MVGVVHLDQFKDRDAGTQPGSLAVSLARTLDSRLRRRGDRAGLGRSDRLDRQATLARPGLDLGARRLRGGDVLDGLGVPLDVIHIEVLRRVTFFYGLAAAAALALLRAINCHSPTVMTASTNTARNTYARPREQRAIKFTGPNSAANKTEPSSSAPTIQRR